MVKITSKETKTALLPRSILISFGQPIPQEYFSLLLKKSGSSGQEGDYKDFPRMKQLNYHHSLR